MIQWLIPVGTSALSEIACWRQRTARALHVLMLFSAWGKKLLNNVGSACPQQRDRQERSLNCLAHSFGKQPQTRKYTYPTPCYLHPASWAALEQIPWSQASQWFGHRTPMSSVARDWRSSTATQINPAYHQPLEQWLIADICGSHGTSLGWRMTIMDSDGSGLPKSQASSRVGLYQYCEDDWNKSKTPNHCSSLAVWQLQSLLKRCSVRLCGSAFCNVHSIGPSITCVIMVVSLSCGGTSLSWAICTSLMS